MQVPIDNLEKWELVLDTVDKDTIPLDCCKKVLFKLKGGKQKTVNLTKLRANGLGLEDIELVITKTMFDMRKDILNMDFVIDVQSVAEYIQPMTDKLLEKF